MAYSNRLRYIDIAKGIAILCIIIGHLGNWNINRVVFTFHVPIFFCISGFFISKKKSIKDFVKIRFRKLIVPYALTCLTIIVIATFKGAIKNDVITYFATWVFASLYGSGISYVTPFYIPKIGAIWFLWAVFFGGVFLRISLDFNKYVRLIFVVLLFVMGYYSKNIFWFPLSIQAGACATLFMYVGYLARNSKSIVNCLPQEVKIFVVIFAAMNWFSFIKNFQSFSLVSCDFGRGITDIFCSFCACLVVVCISKIIDFKTKFIGDFLSYFGKYSLLVLSVHIIELDTFPWHLLIDKLIEIGLSNFMQLLLMIFIKLMFDLLCVYFLSNIKFIRRAYGIE